MSKLLEQDVAFNGGDIFGKSYKMRHKQRHYLPNKKRGLI